jgi:hypothetical protein
MTPKECLSPCESARFVASRWRKAARQFFRRQHSLGRQDTLAIRPTLRSRQRSAILYTHHVVCSVLVESLYLDIGQGFELIRPLSNDVNHGWSGSTGVQFG